jgi:hypothetical protein
MFGVLLLLALVLATLVVACQRNRLGLGGDVREALLIAGILCGVWLVAGTELLSLGHLLGFVPLLTWWGALVGGLAWLVVRRRRELRGWLPSVRSLGLAEWGLAGGCLLLLSLAALCAVRMPPHNGDSLMYHLPRQLRWLQQGSVAHFPTHDLRQLQMPPYAEFAGLHLMILVGNDSWVNLVQWLALLQTMVAVSLIARELGLALRGQLLAALFVATVPMAYVQASSPKNDLVVSLWLCAGTWLSMRLWTRPACSLFQLVLTGLAFGLLFLTKGTGQFLGLPVALAGAAGLLWKHRSLWWQAALVTTAAVGLLNAGHWTRNTLAFGSLLPGDQIYGNEDHSPPALLGVAVRNGILHLATPSKKLNAQLTKSVVKIHKWLGVDVDDRRTNFCQERFRLEYSLLQGKVSAPGHVLLTLLVGVLIVVGRRRITGLATWVYLALPLVCCLLFCALLKWQPWHARLELPIFCLLAVVLAYGCLHLLPKHGWMVCVASVLAVLVPVVLWTPARGLLARPGVLNSDRLSLFFDLRPKLRRGAEAMAARVAGLRPRVIAFAGDAFGWEYGMERLFLKAQGRQPALFCPLDPNAYNPPGYPSCPPDLVVGIGLTQDELWQAGTGTTYRATEKEGLFTLYQPLPRGVPGGPP